jgi:hypothetical protein
MAPPVQTRDRFIQACTDLLDSVNEAARIRDDIIAQGGGTAAGGISWIAPTLDGDPDPDPDRSTATITAAAIAVQQIVNLLDGGTPTTGDHRKALLDFGG